MLYQLVQRRKIPSGLTGLVMTTPANREPGHKWYMPRRYYHRDNYEFLAGFSYLLSMDRLKQFLKTIITYPGPILVSNFAFHNQLTTKCSNTIFLCLIHFHRTLTISFSLELWPTTDA